LAVLNSLIEDHPDQDLALGSQQAC